MNILEIAKECGAEFEPHDERVMHVFTREVLVFDEAKLEAFAAAVIEDYKASQVAIEFNDYTNDSARLDWIIETFFVEFTRTKIDEAMLPKETI